MSERKMDQSGASGPTEGVRGPLADHRSQSFSAAERTALYDQLVLARRAGGLFREHFREGGPEELEEIAYAMQRGDWRYVAGALTRSGVPDES